MATSKHLLHRPIVVALVVLGAIWFAFLDSYSLTRRIKWHNEHAYLSRENARLQSEIETLQVFADTEPTDKMIERIAREKYGMRRPGETVYPLEKREQP